MRTLFIAFLTLTFLPAIAEANGGSNGGGGTKPTGVIQVRNNGSSTLAVIVDPSDDISADLEAGTLTTTDFILAGGRFVGRNGTATFGGLQSGTHTVLAAYVSNISNSATISTTGTVDVDTTNGRTTTVRATGSVSGGATLTGPNGVP